MKNLLFALILVASGSAIGQPASPTPTPTPVGFTITVLKAKAKSNKADKDLVIGYDKFKDKSFIETKSQNLVGGGEMFAAALLSSSLQGYPTLLLLQVEHIFRGERLVATPNVFSVVFMSNSKNWVFLKGDRNLYIIYDDQRLEIHPVDSDSSVGSSSVYEALGFEISREDLQKILSAKKVEMKLGDTFPRKWKSDWSRRIQRLLDITKID